MVTFDSTAFSVASLAAVLICLFIVQRRRGRKVRKYLPCPFSFPVVGNIPQYLIHRRKPLYETVQQWRTLYGDIFMTELGAVRIIWVCGLGMAREVLLHKGSKFDSRPNWMSAVMETRRNEGILFNSGETYRQLKRLLDNAAGSCPDDQIFCSRIYDEIKVLTKEFGRIANETKPVQIDNLMEFSFTSLLYGMIFGIRLDPIKREKFQAIVNHIKLSNRLYHVTDMFPWLPRFPFRNKNKLLRENLNELHKDVRDEIRRHKKTINLHKPEDVIDFYIEAKKNGVDISETNLLCLITDCFVADSSADIFQWVLAYIVRHVHIQEVCRAEIVQIVGPRKTISLKDIERLHYTRAIIFEVLRLKGNQLTHPHATFRDVKFAGYLIPKHSLMIVNLASINFDPNLWDRPEEFRPERFLNGNGRLKRMDHFFPYGLGARKCPLDQTSETVLVLFLANILRSFTLESFPESDNIDFSEEQDAFHFPIRPKPFTMKIRNVTDENLFKQ